MWESGIMLAFWGNNEVLTAADCTNPSKRSRYSNRVDSNFIVTVTKTYSSDENEVIQGWK